MISIKKENLPVIGIICGISLVIFGLVYEACYARIPSHGSTTEMMQRIYTRISIAEKVELTGIILLTISIIAFLIKKILGSNIRK